MKPTEETITPEQEPTDNIDWKSKYLYAKAEISNIKKRYEGKEKQMITTATKFALNMYTFNMLDDIMLMIGATKDTNPDIESYKTGLANIYKKHLSELQSLGCEPVQITTFDPDIHEAVYTTKDPEKEDGAITNVVSMGYTYNGELIRPAKVGVNKLNKTEA